METKPKYKFDVIDVDKSSKKHTVIYMIKCTSEDDERLVKIINSDGHISIPDRDLQLRGLDNASKTSLHIKLQKHVQKLK